MARVKGELQVKKGRHRRYEEARMAKRAFVKPVVRCVECGGDSVHGHAEWCMAASEEEQLLEEHEEFLADDDDDDDEEDEEDGDDSGDPEDYFTDSTHQTRNPSRS